MRKPARLKTWKPVRRYEFKSFQMSLWNKESTSTSKFDEVITRAAWFCGFCSLLDNVLPQLPHTRLP